VLLLLHTEQPTHSSAMSAFTSAEGAAWHPLRCLTRTDCHAGSLYHSFYLIDMVDVEKQQIHVAIQVPSADRLNLDTVYAGLQLFVLDAVSSMLAAEAAKKQEWATLPPLHTQARISEAASADTAPSSAASSVEDGVEADQFGTFVITGENASRHYCCWRGTPQRMFVAASVYPCMSFTRQVLDLVGLESQEQMLATLTSLCEAPIQPACGLRYEFMFNQGRKVSIRISEGEQVNDTEIFMLATHVMHPMMIVSAWEAIVLERKVLVRCSTPSLIAPCCEFFRRLVLPYVVVNTYVPVLSEQLLTAIEAPFPYLVGADTAILSKYPWIDLSDTVVVDLDSRIVTFPTYDSARAPKSMVDRLTQEISAVYLRKYDALLQRPFHSAARVRENLTSQNKSSLYSEVGNERVATDEANAVLSIFIRENIALVCARNNNLSAFVRQPSATKFPGVSSAAKAKKPPADLEWDVSRGLTCGMMNFLDPVMGKMSVWVEANHLSIDVYQYADHLPYVVMRYKDIESVSANSGEPEGQLFQISLKNQTTLLFQIYYTENRLKWLALIDNHVKRSSRSAKIRNGDAETHEAGKGKEGEDGSEPLDSNDHNEGRETEGAPVSRISNKLSEKEDPFNFEDLLLPLPASGKDAAAEMPKPSPIIAVAPKAAETTSQREEAKAIQQTEEKEDRDFLQFRAAFMSTQMMSCVESQMVPESFDSYLHKLGLTFEQSYVAQRDICSFQEKYLCNPAGGLVEDILKATNEEYEAKREIFDWTKRVPNNLNNSPLVSDDPDNAHNSSKASSELLSFAKTMQQTTNEKVPDANHSRKNSIFGGSFFRKSSRSVASSVPVAAAPLNPSDMASLEMQARAAREEERKAEAKQLLGCIVMSYRRCLNELRASLVDDRVDVLAHLVQHNAYVRRGVVEQKPITLRIVSASPSALGSKTSAGNRDRNTSFDEIEKRDRGGSSSGAGAGAGQTSWLDHVWESLKPYALDGAGHTRKENAELYSSLTNNVRLDFLRQLEEQQVTGEEHLNPVLQMCTSHLYNEMSDIENVLKAYKEGKLASQNKLMLCLCRRFVEQVKSQTFSTPAYLGWAMQFGKTVSLQAYRLIMHLMYENVQAFYAHMSDSALDDSLVLDSKTKGIFGTTKTGDLMQNTDRSGISKTGRHDNSPDTTFTWIENRSRKARETLNESFICSSSVNAARPVELSIYLATKVRDLLSVYCSSPTGKLFASTASGRTKLDLTAARVKDIKASAAFTNFELQVCELQRVDLKSLRTNQLCVFFVNVHNTLALHAIILNGSPGTTTLQRNTFGQHKYLIGTMMFSLFEMELAILRHKSKKANVFGYYQDESFRESDPRSLYRLSQPFPFLTFVLFTATDASPPMVILREPDNLDAEFATHAREYVRMYVRTRRENYTANVPGILRVYLEDFVAASKSKNPSKAFMKMLITLAPDRLKSELEAIFMNKTGQVAVPRLLFDNLNWQPYIIL